MLEMPEGSYELGSVHSSVLPSFCPSILPSFYLEVFSELAKILGKWAKNGQQIGF